MVISVLRVLGVYLPLAFTAQWLWGLNGLFIATAATNVITGLMGYFWLRRYLTGTQQQAVPERL